MAALRPRHVFVCCLVALLVLFGIAISQSGKLQEIEKKQQELTTKYDALKLEEQRLESMLEYAQTDEYLAQYAREKFGYLRPEDYKFYIDEKAKDA